jgi:peptidyl-prolyl cis-trans isomerase SurA
MKLVNRQNIKAKIIFSFHLVVLLHLVFATFVTAEVVDKVAAVVNNDIITQSEIEEEASRIFNSRKTEESGSDYGTMAEARDLALNGLIDRRLINQRAKATNTIVSNEELEAAFTNTRNRMGLSASEFRKKLEQSGLTEELYKKQLHDQVLQNKLVSQDVRAKIVVTDAMIRAYYDEHFSTKIDKNGFYLLQIGFQWDPSLSEPALSKSKDEAQKKAEEALKLVKKGQDFKAVAKKLSELPSAGDGGDLGIIKPSDMASNMRDAVSSLKIDEVSNIILASDSFQFYKRLAITDQTTALSSNAFDKVKNEIKEKLYEEKLKAAFSEWVKNLKEKAYIQKL